MTSLPDLPRPRNFHLQWHLTERCNLSCSHCYQEGAKYSELEGGQLFSIADQYVNAAKVWRLSPSDAHVSLTGGEPLLHKDFFPLLEHCISSSALTCNVFTNGTLFSRSDIRRLADIGLNGLVQVSLEGLEGTNDSIRGSGTFKKIVSFLESVISEGLSSRIAVTLSRRNLAEVPAMVSLASELGVDFIMFERLVPHGSGASMRDALLSPAEFKKVSEYLDGKHIELDHAGKKPEILPHCHNLLHPGCSCAYNSLTILPDGSVVPCRKLPVRVGSLRDNSLLGIWYGSGLLWQMRDRSRVDHCSSCPRFSSCHGGARCVAYTYFNDLFAPDPQCWFSFDRLPAECPPAINASQPVFPETYIEFPGTAPVAGDYLFFSDDALFLKSGNEDVMVSFLDLDASALPSKVPSSSGLLLLSFSYPKAPDASVGKGLAAFLDSLSSSGIPFRFLKPLPRCIAARHPDLVKLYDIPQSCRDCLALFYLKDGSIHLCGGMVLPDLPSLRSRDSLSRISGFSKKQVSSCSCRYSSRGQCAGVCLERFL